MNDGYSLQDNIGCAGVAQVAGLIGGAGHVIVVHAPNNARIGCGKCKMPDMSAGEKVSCLHALPLNGSNIYYVCIIN